MVGDMHRTPAPSHGRDLAPVQVLADLPPDLAEQVVRLAAASKAENTRQAYASDWRRWQAWCSQSQLRAMPAAPATVAAYVTAHRDRLAVATLRRHLSSISKAHQVAGHPDPCRHQLVGDTMQGLRRTQGAAQAGAPPLLADQVRQVVAALPAGDLAAIRDRALLLLGWCAALRRSELAGLCWGDLAAHGGGLLVTVRHAKSDHTGEGQQVAVPSQPGQLCPVAAVELWRDTLAELGSELVEPAAPVFRRVDMHGNLRPLRSDGRGLSGHAVGAVIAARAAQAGLQGYTGHSLRVGLAWSASLAGRSDSELMQTMRHRSLTMVRRYQRDAGAMERAASRGLLA